MLVVIALPIYEKCIFKVYQIIFNVIEKKIQFCSIKLLSKITNPNVCEVIVKWSIYILGNKWKSCIIFIFYVKWLWSDKIYIMGNKWKVYTIIKFIYSLWSDKIYEKAYIIIKFIYSLWSDTIYCGQYLKKAYFIINLLILCEVIKYIMGNV